MRIDLADLMEMRAAYQARVEQHVGAGAEDMAMSAECMEDVLSRITAMASSGKASWADGRPFVVAELGSGFSTLALTELVERFEASPVTIRIISVDHDIGWQRFVMELVNERLKESVGARRGDYRFLSFDEFKRIPLLAKEPDAHSADVIIVDHGPQLETRASDTSTWLPPHLRKGGLFIFDDWRPKHEGRIRRALAGRKGEEWVIESGGDHLKRFPRDKTVGYAWRKGGR